MAATSAPVKIGVIGLGRFGRLHALTLAGPDFSAGFLAITLAHFIIWSSTTVAGFALLLSVGGLSSRFKPRRTTPRAAAERKFRV